MKLLLDTHIFLWWCSDPEKLSKKVLSYILDSENEVFISTVSVWEIQIKKNLGKFHLEQSLEQMITEQVNINGISILETKVDHIYELDKLPDIHNDPFDRLLISQARTEQLLLVSTDKMIQNYDIEVLW